MHTLSFTLPLCQVLDCCWLKQAVTQGGFLVGKIEEHFCDGVCFFFFLSFSFLGVCNPGELQVVPILCFV